MAKNEVPEKAKKASGNVQVIYSYKKTNATAQNALEKYLISLRVT